MTATPIAPASCCDRVEHARRGADLVVVDRRQDEVEQRRDDHARCRRRAPAAAGDQLERAGVQPVGEDHLAQPPAPRRRAITAAICSTVAPEPRHQHGGGEHGADRRAERERRQREPGVDRREVLAELQEQREHQHRADHPGEEHHDRSRARRCRRGGRRCSPRPADRGRAGARRRLQTTSAANDDRAARDHQVGPRRPARLAALDQRIDRAGPCRAPPARCRPGPAAAAARRRDSGISATAPIAAIRPSGRLTKKISRQPVPNALAATSAPPMIGPSTADSPITGPNTANADPSSRGGERVADDPEALRDQQRRGRALGQPAGDQHRRARPRTRTPPRRPRSRARRSRTGACGRRCRRAARR